MPPIPVKGRREVFWGNPCLKCTPRNLRDELQYREERNDLPGRTCFCLTLDQKVGRAAAVGPIEWRTKQHRDCNMADTRDSVILRDAGVLPAE